MKGVAILGSTGSVGASALEVVEGAPDRLRAVALAAGRNVERLAAQVLRHRPVLCSVEREEDRAALLARLPAEARPEVLVGEAGAVAVASHPEASAVLCAMVGAVGLRPTLRAIERGVHVAIANKEPLVLAGRLCTERARQSGATVLPVDSEHNAIFQSLRGHRSADVHRIWLTRSGGPFRTVADLDSVTLEQALHHPTWAMGKKITVDSSTLMNKGLEVIEARWLFDVPAERIQILIHPESVVHSMVEYIDGSVVAQLGPTDMRVPISYALGFPERLARPASMARLDLLRIARLNFESPSFERFPCLGLAYRALELGGTAPAVLNAANEVAVAAFLDARIRYRQIPALIARVLEAHPVQPGEDLEQLLEADRWARERATSELGRG